MKEGKGEGRGKGRKIKEGEGRRKWRDGKGREVQEGKGGTGTSLSFTSRKRGEFKRQKLIYPDLGARR